MRRSLLIGVPLAIGAVVFACAAAYPSSLVHGTGITGPKPPANEVAAKAGADYRVSWADRHERILLRVRDGRRCEPILHGERSTAPARIEVSITRPTGLQCQLEPKWWRFDLTTPTVSERGQGVEVLIDGAVARLHQWRT